MKLDSIMQKLGDDQSLDEIEQGKLRKEIEALDEPVKSSLLGTFLRRYPPSDIADMID